MQIEVDGVKDVYVAFSNTDRTEGRGRQYPLLVTDTLETAERLTCGRYVMGSNCPISQYQAFKIGNWWYAPVDIHFESLEDRERRLHREKKELAKKQLQIVLSRAVELGLTKEEIEVLQGTGK